MKTTPTEATDTLDCTKCRLDIAEGKISELKDLAIETIQNGTQETDRKK